MAEQKKQGDMTGEDMVPFKTVKETAEDLRLCEKQVRRLIKKGDLPAYRFGTAIRLSPSDVKAYIAKRRV